MSGAPAERYEAVQLPADERGHAPWAVVDRTTGRWVEAGGEVDTHTMEHGALALIRRLHYLDNAGILHG